MMAEWIDCTDTEVSVRTELESRSSDDTEITGLEFEDSTFDLETPNSKKNKRARGMLLYLTVDSYHPALNKVKFSHRFV